MITRAVSLGIITSILISIVLGISIHIMEQDNVLTESFGLVFAEKNFVVTYDVFDNPPKFFGDNMIIASPGKSVDGVWGAGNISVINPDRNSLLYTIHNPEPQKNIRFGENIGISDSHILVGMQGKISSVYDDDNNPSKIYIFDGNTGKLLHSIKNPNESNSNINFRSTFSGIGAIGDIIIAGSYFDELNDFPTHVMHAFDGKTGELLYTIDSPISGSVSFGETFETFDNKIAVYTRDDDPNDQKIDDAIHVFDGKTGELFYTINDLGIDTKYDFGSQFIIIDNNIIVGVPVGGYESHFSGVIHVFDGNTGSLLYTITDPGETSMGYDRQFGKYIVDAGDNLAVRSNSMVYIFEGNTGELLETVQDQNLNNVELDMIIDLLDDKNDNSMAGYFFVFLVIGAVTSISAAGLSIFKIKK